MTPRRAGTATGLMLAAAVLLVLAACTKVPTTSTPDVIVSSGLVPPAQPANPPPEGAQPYSIVQGFLEQNADADPNSLSARQYLTQSANARWSDDPVTVVGSPRLITRDNDGPTRSFDVDASKLGTIDATGIYTPVLSGDGNGVAVQFKFETQQVTVPHTSGRQWRISSVQPGLIVNSDDFRQYQQRSIYYYDATEDHLVPDPRYTPAIEPSALATWLMTSLARGPRDSVGASERTELPSQTDPTRVKVSLPKDSSVPARISIPGALQKGVDRLHLAIQIAATLAQVPQISTSGPLTIYDGDEAVAIPGIGTAFSASDFAAQLIRGTDTSLYYLDSGGGVVSDTGARLPGRVGSGYYDLTSVALTDGTDGVDGAAVPGTPDYLVAGTRGADPDHRTLDLGSVTTALKPVAKLSGELSRPAWAPDVHEVWIGDGSTLYRVSTDGVATRVPMSTASGDPVDGLVRAVRLSPEGSRVAVVLESTDGTTSSIWVGNVERGNDTVTADGLAPITADGVFVTDVAWNDALKLYGVGHRVKHDAPQYYEVQCDGSRWSARGTGNLPDEPTAVTVASGHVLTVAAAGGVWQQSGNDWKDLRGGQTEGSAPIYVE